LKVCHFISSTGMGRGEAYIDLVNELCNYMNIYLIIPKDSKYIERINSKIKVYTYKSYDSRLSPKLYFELYNILNRIKPDIVHTHFSKSSQIFYILNKLFNIPHVATKHNSRKGKIFNKLDNIIAVSKGVANTIDNKNVKVIYNGINPITINQKENKNLFTICAVGRLDKIKGFDILIKECRSLNFDFRLNIIGDGEERSNLENLILEYKLENKISLLGFQQNIPQIMADSNVVIMSSHSEGFSLVMVESLFYSNLFISTKVSGATEILDENFLINDFNISDKIIDIYNNYDQYEKKWNNLKVKINNKFIIKNISKEYINYYSNLLDNR